MSNKKIASYVVVFLVALCLSAGFTSVLDFSLHCLYFRDAFYNKVRVLW